MCWLLQKFLVRSCQPIGEGISFGANNFIGRSSGVGENRKWVDGSDLDDFSGGFTKQTTEHVFDNLNEFQNIPNGIFDLLWIFTCVLKLCSEKNGRLEKYITNSMWNILGYVYLLERLFLLTCIFRVPLLLF